MRRLLFLTVGLGAGVVIGVWAVRRAEAASRRLRPEALAATAGARAGNVADRLRLALDEGRLAAAAKEAELRSPTPSATRPATATTTSGRRAIPGATSR